MHNEMMRIFRGKRKDNGKWVQGYFYKIWDKTYILWSMTGDVPNMIEVIPETVSPFTGLYDCTDYNIADKGWQGKQIFKGDILFQGTTEKFEKVNPCFWQRYYVVDFGMHEVRKNYKDGVAYGWYLWDIKSKEKKAIGDLPQDNLDGYYPYKIIGNIYDNPELLNEENNNG